MTSVHWFSFVAWTSSRTCYWPHESTKTRPCERWRAPRKDRNGDTKMPTASSEEPIRMWLHRHGGEFGLDEHSGSVSRAPACAAEFVNADFRRRRKALPKKLAFARVIARGRSDERGIAESTTEGFACCRRGWAACGCGGRGTRREHWKRFTSGENSLTYATFQHLIDIERINATKSHTRHHGFPLLPAEKGDLLSDVLGLFRSR
jgi:hypothetical protein